MLRNYLTIAVRNLRRNRVYAAVSIAGLAVAVACCTLIFLFVRSELSADAVFPDAERTYRVDSEWEREDLGLPFLTLAPASTKMKEVLPEVEERARLWAIGITVGREQTWLRRETFVTDPSLPSFFDLPVVSGQATLPSPRSAMIRADLAQALFGTTDAAGRTFTVKTWREGAQPYIVSGVWTKLPDNSVTGFVETGAQVLLPNTNEDFVPEGAWTSWQSPYIMQFVKLAPGASLEATQVKLDGFIDRYAENPWGEGRLDLALSPLRTLRLTDEGGTGWRLVWMLSAVGALLLLIAAANFTNLATARAMTRAREAGVRKAVGAQGRQIAGQFLVEALLASTAATLLGAALARAAQPAFFDVVGRPLTITTPWDGWTLLALAGLALVAGLLAGAYPAFVLARYRPAEVLRGGQATAEAPGGARLRRGLVVGQFAIAIALLCGVGVVYQQMSFLLSQDLGFQQRGVMVISSVERDPSAEGLRRMKTVKRELRAVPGVEAVSLSASVPGNRGIAGGSGSSVAWRLPGWPSERAVDIGFERADDDFLDTYDLTLKTGRVFSDERPADSTRVVLNEAAVRAFGLRQPVGQTLKTGAADSSSIVTVAGVVEDFHQSTLHAPVKPLVFVPVRYAPFYKYLSLRLAPGANLSQTVENVRQTWTAVLPETPFQFEFIDDRIEQAYRAEIRTQQIAGGSALLAVFIAVLGLFGLAAFAAERRRKEIGIRKVLGASVASVVALLSKDFAKLVGVAFVLAAPVAYFAMRRWLEDFAYRIELSPWLFLAAGAAALAVALATVSVQALRAATANPTDALRAE